MPRRTTDDRPRRRDADDSAHDPTGGGLGTGAWVGIGVAAVIVLVAAGVGGWWVMRSKPATPTATGSSAPGSGASPSVGLTANAVPRLTPKHTVRATVGGIAHVFVSADGKRAAVGGDDGNGTIEVWNLSPAPAKAQSMPGVLRAFAPDGKQLVRTGKASAVEVVSADTGAVVTTLQNAGGSDFRFATPGQVVSVQPSEQLPGGRPGQFVVVRFNTRTGTAVGSFMVAGLPTYGGLSADRQQVAFGSARQGMIEFRNLDSGLFRQATTLRAAPNPGATWTRLWLSPDGKRVGVRDGAERVTVYDAATGAEVGSSGEMTAGITFVPGRDWILSAEYIRHPVSSGHGLRARTPPSYAVVADLPAASLEPAVSNDGRVLVTGLNGEASPDFAVWDLTAIP